MHVRLHLQPPNTFLALVKNVEHTPLQGLINSIIFFSEIAFIVTKLRKIPGSIILSMHLWE